MIALGLGSLGLGAVLGRFHWAFIAAAGALLVFGWWMYFKESRRCQAAQCRMENRNAARTVLGGATLVVLFFVGLNLYTYVLKPSLAVTAQASPTAAHLTEVVLPVEGMTCFTCELTVANSLKKVPGVTEAEASAKDGVARVVYDPRQTTVEALVEAVNQTGYRARPPQAR